MHGEVEAGVFDGGADDDAPGMRAVGAGHEIKVRGADDDGEIEPGGHAYGEHLAFARSDGCGGPAAHAIDQGGGLDGELGGLDTDRGVMGDEAFEPGVFAQVDPGVAHGPEERGAELARVHGVLAEEMEGAAADCELRQQFARVGIQRRERVGIESDGFEGGGGLEGNAGAGERGDAVEELRVERGAELGERMQGRWIQRVVDGEHTGRGEAGLTHGGAGFEDHDGGTAAVEFQCEREPDDAGACDDKVG